MRITQRHIDIFIETLEERLGILIPQLENAWIQLIAQFLMVGTEQNLLEEYSNMCELVVPEKEYRCTFRFGTKSGIRYRTENLAGIVLCVRENIVNKP